MSGTLYIVSTPIGNLEDISFRAIRILKEVTIIAAEDTRRTQKLCSYYQIGTPLTSYHDFNKEEKTAVLLEHLHGGSHIALVCDAGTPLVSDPGYYLVTRAIRSQHSPRSYSWPIFCISCAVCIRLSNRSIYFLKVLCLGNQGSGKSFLKSFNQRSGRSLSLRHSTEF